MKAVEIFNAVSNVPPSAMPQGLDFRRATQLADGVELADRWIAGDWPVTAEWAALILEGHFSRILDRQVNHWGTVTSTVDVSVVSLCRGHDGKSIGKGATRLHALAAAVSLVTTASGAAS